MTPMSIMEQEARQAPKIIANQLQANYAILTDLCRRLKKSEPGFAVTVARGSSDHAANFAKYLFESQLNLVTASAAPSVTTLYKSQLKLKNSLVMGFSQSGQSPDVCEMMEMARKQGAITVAMVNHENSPLAQAAEYVIPLLAGEEVAVAATKSYLASLAGIVNLVAIYKEDAALKVALAQLPELLEQALSCDWTPALEALKPVSDSLIVARGYGFPIAQEAALKLKETCALHAEAFSSAEIMHGPLALIGANFPVMLFAQEDESLPGILELSHSMTELGGHTILALPKNIECTTASKVLIDLPPSLHPLLDPLMTIQAFYPMAAKLSQARGLNPDHPQNLSKVTKTL
ncbi:MAG: SIS domain-containing protein [Gammaproteobacteria bacterium]|nr:SIS domain-containing protein [Gammaproteobacteria bacterium]